MQDRFRILVLGGYGHFGSRIVRHLGADPRLQLIVAGRDPAVAAAACTRAREEGAQAGLEPLQIDHGCSDLATRVSASGANLVIHTAGPFQGQDYGVARACINARAHYLDLADGRDFVAGIGILDQEAREKNVLVASGASTLPAVSSAVVGSLAPRLERVESIGISIAPGQDTPRGVGTLAAVLNYCGRPYKFWGQGMWTTEHGWQRIRTHDYPGLGTRWMAGCDVPDLELLPRSYPDVKSVRFDAAMELRLVQCGFWLISWLVRLGLLSHPEALAPHLLAVGRLLDRFGTDVGGMCVSLTGLDTQGRHRQFSWYLTARDGHGPEIPVMPAVILARKLGRGELATRGAMPCMGMISLEEFMQSVESLAIETVLVERDA